MKKLKFKKASSFKLQAALTMDLGSCRMILSDSNLKYAVGLSQFKKLVLITMFAVAHMKGIKYV